jgi:hypothetical protein
MKAFGDRSAADVTTAEVSQLLRSLDREGLTPRNVNKHREVLASMFAYGCRSDPGANMRRRAPGASTSLMYRERRAPATRRPGPRGPGWCRPRGWG